MEQATNQRIDTHYDTMKGKQDGRASTQTLSLFSSFYLAFAPLISLVIISRQTYPQMVLNLCSFVPLGIHSPTLPLIGIW